MENLHCPYCGGEMQKGWLRSRRSAEHPCPHAYPPPLPHILPPVIG